MRIVLDTNVLVSGILLRLSGYRGIAVLRPRDFIADHLRRGD